MLLTKSSSLEDDEQFEALLQQLGFVIFHLPIPAKFYRKIFCSTGVQDLVGENDEALRAMWENLNANPNPEIMAAFEEVLAKLTGDLQRKSAEHEDLETTLKIRHKSQEEHLQILYEVDNTAKIMC